MNEILNWSGAIGFYNGEYAQLPVTGLAAVIAAPRPLLAGIIPAELKA